MKIGFLPLALVATFLSFFAHPAEACSCFAGPNLIERRDQHGTAFVGRLLATSLDTSTTLVTLTFAVDSVWDKGKKEKRKSIEVETPLGSAACGYEAPLGESILVFASPTERNGKRVLTTGLCAQNLLAPDSGQIDSLWAKAKGKPKGKPEGKKARK